MKNEVTYFNQVHGYGTIRFEDNQYFGKWDYKDLKRKEFNRYEKIKKQILNCMDIIYKVKK